MDEELEFFDSNILIAASVPAHIHHPQSNARVAAVRKGGGACGAHSLAEAYNILKNQRRGYGVPPVDAARLVEQFSKIFLVVALTPAETLRTIQDAAQRGTLGPMIYDALLLACARKSRAGVIYTSNVKHFRQIAPDLADIIVEP